MKNQFKVSIRSLRDSFGCPVVFMLSSCGVLWCSAVFRLTAKQKTWNYETLSPRWLRYHPSEASCLLHHARRHAHSMAEISVRRLAIISQIQNQNNDVE